MINANEEKIFDFQFTAMPTNLMACMDLNCRSMLFTLIQLSSYYAKDDGWFFRTNEDLRAESKLSENLVRATLSTLYTIGVVDIKAVGKGKSKTPNQFRLNVDKFKDWEQYSLEDCIKHPDFKIYTDSYKVSGWQPSYLQEVEVKTDDVPILSPIPSPTPPQSEDYIENINNKNNTLYEGSKLVERNSNQFEGYKRQEDVLMDKLYNVSNWTDFKYIRKDIEKLISIAMSEKIAERTRKRYKKIEEGKIKLFKSKISKEPYNPYYDDFYQDDFYQETGCGWIGKEKSETKQKSVQPQNNVETEDEGIAEMRNFYMRFGMEIPDEYKAKEVSKDKYAIKVPILNGDSNDDDLPF